MYVDLERLETSNVIASHTSSTNIPLSTSFFFLKKKKAAPLHTRSPTTLKSSPKISPHLSTNPPKSLQLLPPRAHPIFSNFPLPPTSSKPLHQRRLPLLYNLWDYTQVAAVGYFVNAPAALLAFCTLMLIMGLSMRGSPLSM